ncbi:MAG: hypothetical protein PHU86_02790 [Patescibacteria group bacterium]|jgi:hypothetical protein|nr:hypothetical protein [Patescibacteria group bacterium]
MFKIIRKIIKWGIRLAILVLIIFVIIFIYNFLINGITGQASKKCQEITTQNGSGKEVVYTALADWLKTQSTSIVMVTDAYYKNDSKKGDQVIVKYSLYKNIYSGQRTIDSKTLQKFCGI